MKKMFYSFLAAAALLMAAPEADAAEAPKVGVVSFKACVEESKVGKKEQEFFERLKSDMQKTLQQKEKSLQDLAQKVQDPEYIDSLSPDAEAELKHRLRTASQDYGQYQQESYQQLQFANVKIIQNIQEIVGKASTRVAQKKGLVFIGNEENAFYYSDELDVTKEVISEMDAIYAEDTQG